MVSTQRSKGVCMDRYGAGVVRNKVREVQIVYLVSRCVYVVSRAEGVRVLALVGVSQQGSSGGVIWFPELQSNEESGWEVCMYMYDRVRVRSKTRGVRVQDAYMRGRV